MKKQKKNEKKISELQNESQAGRETKHPHPAGNNTQQMNLNKVHKIKTHKRMCIDCLPLL